MKWDVQIDQQITDLNLNSRVLTEKKPINRFVIGSTLLHILSASAIVMLGQFPQQKQELVEIDFSSAPISTESSAPIPAPEIQEAAPAIQAPPQPEIAAVKSEPSLPAEPVAPVAKIQETKPEVVKPQPKPVAKPIVAAKVEQPKPAPAVAAEPEPTLDDIETPALDDSEVATALKEEQSQPKVSKAEVEEKLKQAEKAQAEKTALLAKQMEQETNSTEQSINDQLSETESAVAAENQALAAQAESRANALKAQKEAAEKASKEDGEGLAAQNAGPGQPGELRTLEQLRQMPGNPKPQYEPHERLQGQQGNVIFKAFVTPNGELTQFQLLQSTGHRNLDSKTLKALKQWKFYPGQQGWVELPFKWDLKGGPQEMPTLLRRRVSEKN